MRPDPVVVIGWLVLVAFSFAVWFFTLTAVGRAFS